MKRLGIFIMCCLCAVPAAAETIVLKTGKTVEGDILKQTDEYIQVDFHGVPLRFYLDEVATIDGKSLAASPDSGVTFAADKSGVWEKHIAANQKEARIKTRAVSTIESSFLHMKTETIGNIDYENKVYQQVTTFLEYQMSMPQISDSYLDSKGSELGRSSEEVAKIKAILEQTRVAMQGAMKTMGEELKKTKQEMIMNEKAMYLGVGETLIKMDVPWADKWWESLRDVQAGQVPNEGLSDFVATVSPEMKPYMASLTSGLGVARGLYDPQYLHSVEEGTFQGEGCFVLNMRSDKLVDIMKENLMSQIEQAVSVPAGEGGVSMEDFSYREFVDHDSYRTLGFQMQVAMNMAMPGKETIPLVMTTEGTTTYPKAPFRFDLKRRKIREVKDDKEFQQVMQEELKKRMAGTMKMIEDFTAGQ